MRPARPASTIRSPPPRSAPCGRARRSSRGSCRTCSTLSASALAASSLPLSRLPCVSFLQMRAPRTRRLPRRRACGSASKTRRQTLRRGSSSATGSGFYSALVTAFRTRSSSARRAPTLCCARGLSMRTAPRSIWPSRTLARALPPTSSRCSTRAARSRRWAEASCRAALAQASGSRSCASCSGYTRARRSNCTQLVEARARALRSCFGSPRPCRPTHPRRRRRRAALTATARTACQCPQVSAACTWR